MPLYAKAGVRELWIENLREDVILVYRDPRREAFATSLVSDAYRFESGRLMAGAGCTLGTGSGSSYCIGHLRSA